MVTYTHTELAHWFYDGWLADWFHHKCIDGWRLVVVVGAFAEANDSVCCRNNEKKR